MTTETPYQQTIRESSEGSARYAAEIAADPMQAAMVKAMHLTADEQRALDAAQEAVTAAEVAVNAAGMALNRARRGMAPAHDRKQPFSFFERSPASHKAAAQAAAPGLAMDVEEARTHLQLAIRRRNDLAHNIEGARMERRRLAKLAHTPAREPVRSRNDGWGSVR